MLKRLAIILGLATTSLLGPGTMSILLVKLATPAYAQCARNFEDCAHVVILQCGDETFVGGSDIGNAVDIARIKARNAGHNPNYCQVRNR